jgi:tRNA threonylcarbamoyl adenosine modification protein YeaZ
MILALDSSSESGSAALLEGERVIRAINFAGGRARGSGAAFAIEELAAGEDSVERVVVGLGPGSYNGIRSSVSAAWGFAIARGASLTGVSSLLAISQGEYLAVGDARQGHFYFAHVSHGEFLVEPGLLTGPNLLQALAHRRELPVYTSSEMTSLLPESVVSVPQAILLARYAGDAGPCTTIPQPLYLKPPHITKPRSAS